MTREIDPSLLRRLRKDPDQHVDMIVTVEGDLHRYESRLRAFDLEVKRTFVLTQKLALGGSARCFMALINESWVTKLEEDKPVQALD